MVVRNSGDTIAHENISNPATNGVDSISDYFTKLPYTYSDSFCRAYIVYAI